MSKTLTPLLVSSTVISLALESLKKLNEGLRNGNGESKRNG
jgi:hypothetical protein